MKQKQSFRFRFNDYLDVKDARKTGAGWTADIEGRLLKDRGPVRRSRVKLYDTKDRLRFANEFLADSLNAVPLTAEQKIELTRETEQWLIAIADRLDEMQAKADQPVAHT